MPNPGQKLDNKEIIKWAKEQTAFYKYPRTVEIKDALPIAATGEIYKKRLKADNLNIY